MKTVIIIANSFPPINTISVCRYLSMARYLPEFGWKVIVVTPDWTLINRTELEKKIGAIPNDSQSVFSAWDPQFTPDDGMRVERVPFRSRDDIGENKLKRIWSKCRAHYYDYLLGDLPREMLKRVRKICQYEDVDAILSSGVPEYLFRIPNTLFREQEIPWIADYRDLVDQNPIEAADWRSYSRQWLARKVFIFRNSLLVRSASARVIVSERLVDKLYSRNSIPVQVIMNGFDPVDFPYFDKSLAPCNKKLTISYGGTIYPYQRPALFLEGLVLFLKKTPEARGTIQVQFFGQSCDFIRNSIPLELDSDTVSLQGNIPRPELLNRLCKSDILLFLSVQSKWIPAKIFEYLASKRPILSVPGDRDITDEILSASNIGKGAETAEEISCILEHWFIEWQDKGSISIEPNMSEISKYSRKSQTKQLSRLLNSVTGDQ